MQNPIQTFIERTINFNIDQTVRLDRDRSVSLYEAAAFYPGSLPIPLYYYGKQVQPIIKQHWLENRNRVHDAAYREEIQQLLERTFTEARIRDELRMLHAPAKPVKSIQVTEIDTPKFIQVTIYTPEWQNSTQSYSITGSGRVLADDERERFFDMVAERFQQANDDPAEFYRE